MWCPPKGWKDPRYATKALTTNCSSAIPVRLRPGSNGGAYETLGYCGVRWHKAERALGQASFRALNAKGPFATTGPDCDSTTGRLETVSAIFNKHSRFS